MPTDKAGKFHLNPQRMMAANKMPSKPKPQMGGGGPPAEKQGSDMGESIGHTTLHEHGDGTFHTEGHDGETMQHPHIGHALKHMADKHAPGEEVNMDDHDGDEGGMPMSMGHSTKGIY